MRLQRLSVYALVTIAAIAGTQSTALSQGTFKTPTHPTLAEITTLDQTLINRAESLSATQFKTSTHPTLSEVGLPSRRAIPAMPAMLPQASVSRGQLFFSHAPRLVRVNASQKVAHTPSTYEFTVSVPSDAGASLQAVRIVQDPNLNTVKFNVSQSQAFLGKQYAAGPELSLASIGGAQPAPGAATIVFDQPVQPGNTVTIALDVKANPATEGVYEFGVTAFPTSEKGEGLFLGYGRINLYSGGN
jgi:Protein of unknown function (DUF2808)